MYISHDEAARQMGWQPSDLRALRRTLHPKIEIGRPPKTCAGRPRDHLELLSFLSFANLHVGLDQMTADALVAASAPLPTRIESENG